MRLPFVLSLSLLLLVAPPLLAQEGREVEVVLRSGETVRGRLLGLADGLYAVETAGGRRELREADVAELRFSDPAAAPAGAPATDPLPVEGPRAAPAWATLVADPDDDTSIALVASEAAPLRQRGSAETFEARTVGEAAARAAELLGADLLLGPDVDPAAPIELTVGDVTRGGLLRLLAHQAGCEVSSWCGVAWLGAAPAWDPPAPGASALRLGRTLAADLRDAPLADALKIVGLACGVDLVVTAPAGALLEAAPPARTAVRASRADRLLTLLCARVPDLRWTVRDGVVQVYRADERLGVEGAARLLERAAGDLARYGVGHSARRELEALLAPPYRARAEDTVRPWLELVKQRLPLLELLRRARWVQGGDGTWWLDGQPAAPPPAGDEVVQLLWADVDAPGGPVAWLRVLLARDPRGRPRVFAARVGQPVGGRIPWQGREVVVALGATVAEVWRESGEGYRVALRRDDGTTLEVWTGMGGVGGVAPGLAEITDALGSGRRDEALALADRRLLAQPGSAEALALRAEACLARDGLGQPTAGPSERAVARAHARRALELSPRCARARWVLALLDLAQRGSSARADARREAARAVADGLDDPLARLLQAEPADGAARLDALLEGSPGSAPLRLHRALLRLDRAGGDLAPEVVVAIEADLAAAEQASPQEPMVHGLRGRLLLARAGGRDGPEAAELRRTGVQALDRALALDPALDGVRLERARALLRQGLAQPARRDLELLRGPRAGGAARLTLASVDPTTVGLEWARCLDADGLPDQALAAYEAWLAAAQADPATDPLELEAVRARIAELRGARPRRVH